MIKISRYTDVDVNIQIDDKIFNHVYETMIHKSLVIKVCLKMSMYLYNNGDVDLAYLLLQRSNYHDNSKLIGPELQLLSELSNLNAKKEVFKDPKVLLSTNESEIIKKHWENNSHHPEHFNNVQEMSELDIIEMVCDWCARSIQYGTDLLDFVKTRQENRFHFPDSMFDKIWNYCKIVKDFEW